jgi:hypothetical protein
MSRRVQMRLLLMIMTFGATLWMMNEVRKPENWRWFTALDQQSQAAADLESNPAEPDTRISQRPPPETDPPGIITMESDASAVEIELPEAGSGLDARSRARHDAWEQALGSLDHQQRRLFDRMMLAARGRAQLADENTELRKDVLAKLHRQWSSYLQEALGAIVEQQENLSEEEKASWLLIIQQMESNWENGILPALTTVSSGGELNDEQRELLAEAQAVIDEVNIEAIVDNSITRPSDAPAWFRLLEQLQATEQAQLDTPQVPQVGFVELFDQPDVYRGKLVRVEGVIKLAKRVRPRENPLGIDEYYMFWLRPDGSSSPMAIYTLELPPDFPELDYQGVELDTRASFTGFFFKRWVYAAGDGPRIAPELLAKIPTWTPEPAAKRPALPQTNVITMIIAGAAALGIAIAVLVYLTARGKSSIRSPYNTAVQQAPERLAMLEQQPTPLTAGEKLEEYMSGEASRRGDEL